MMAVVPPTLARKTSQSTVFTYTWNILGVHTENGGEQSYHSAFQGLQSCLEYLIKHRSSTNEEILYTFSLLKQNSHV